MKLCTSSVNAMDRKILVKSAKLIILGLLAIAGMIMLLLIVTTFNQQIVYWNTGIDRNAFSEVFTYTLGGY